MEGDAMPGLLEGLCKVAEARKVEIIRNVPEAEMDGAHGQCWFTGENGKLKIKTQRRSQYLSEIHTLAHELGHSILHNRDEYLEHDSTSIKELEAESVAMLVCNSYDMTHVNVVSITSWSQHQEQRCSEESNVDCW